MITPTLLAAEDALLSTLREASPLAGLFEPVGYLRELRPHLENDGNISLQLDRRGYRRYKNHNKKPLKNPSPINTEKIRSYLNSIIDSRFYITAVTDEKTYAKIFMYERKQKL